MNNKVIIIGNDHINTLGLIRTFGENNIFPYVFLVNDSKNSFIIKSKYIKKYWISDNENISILKMIDEFSLELEKPIVIPSSDQAAYLLDMMYDRLKDNFIIPSISKKSGCIIKFMNKFAQYELCQKFNIKMANSISFDLNSNDIDCISLPCIIKPIVSASGNKDDISICYDKKQLSNSLEYFRNNNYDTVIIQDFIEYDYECDIVGFSYYDKCYIPGVLKKNRIWPLKKGSTTYGEVIPNSNYENMINDLKRLMSNIDFNGIFDIEVFVKGNEFYLNEINFRNSAISYAYSNSYVPYYWYLTNIKKEFHKGQLVLKNYTFINDVADLHNVLDKNITFKTYKQNKKKSQICLADNPKDKKPYFYMIFKIIVEKLGLNKIISYSTKIYHKDISEYIMCMFGNNITDEFYNTDYDVIEFNENNFNMICENDHDIKEFGSLIKSKKGNGIALVKDKKIIARGFIKYKGASDRFLKINSSNSFLISSIHVFPEFRGKNYQYDLIKELIFKYIEKLNNETKIYAVVYKYNIPSFKNLKKLGFNILKEKTIIRFLGKSLNKENV